MRHLIEKVTKCAFMSLMQHSSDHKATLMELAEVMYVTKTLASLQMTLCVSIKAEVGFQS